jgi:hypothetical protein
MVRSLLGEVGNQHMQIKKSPLLVACGLDGNVKTKNDSGPQMIC